VTALGRESGVRGSDRSLGYQVFILVLSVFAIAIMAFVTVVKVSPSTQTIIDSADNVVCVVFLIDFVATLVNTPNKIRYMATWGWLDLLSSLPAVDVARWGRAARMFRILRVLRAMRATRIMASLAIKHRARNAAFAGVLLLILIVFSCSIAVLHFEDVEGGNIRTASDAMWWAATTVSTVGYGDFYPVTWEGRLVALVLMVTGVGSFGAIAAGLASWFMDSSRSGEQTEIEKLTNEVQRMRELLEQPDRRSSQSETVTLLVAAVMLLAASGVAAEKPSIIPEGQTVTGRCVGVFDGDSMTLLVDTPDGKRQSKIRLDAIDAPEMGQPFSNRSKQTLSGMVFDKQCAVESVGPDRYGRTIGRVTVDGKDVNAAMLEVGMAWHYEKYDDRQSMADRQEAARKAGVGLWGDPRPIPPWEWRKMSKEERAPHREKAGSR